MFNKRTINRTYKSSIGKNMKINFFLVKLNNHGLGQKAVFAYLNAESWVTATNLEKEQKKYFEVES
jgi:hypothetical protein